MANEIHSLKIGDVEYPIYSEGIKLDTSASNSDYFLTTSGDSGNKKVGISNAIIGNSTSLSLAADTISIGNGYEGYEPTVIIGDNAGMLYIGSGSTNPVTIHIGAGNDGEAPSNIKMGTPEGSIEIGDSATELRVGNSADLVEVGNSATELRVGNYGTTIGIGNFADEVNIGHMSYGVNIGNQCEGNVVIADGCVWYSEDEDGNEVVEKTTNTYIGENNNAVNIGASASGVVVGPGATNVILGPNTNYVLLGGNAKTINIGSTTTSDISIVAGSDEADATIEFYDTDGLYDASQKINIKSTEVNACSQLVLNGAEVELSSNYEDGSSYKSCIYATDKELQITQLNSTDTASIFMSGHDDNQDCSVIDIKATRISIGHSDDYETGVPYVYIGNSAEGVDVGTNGAFINIGYNSGNVWVGGYNLTIGETGTDNATDNIKINAGSYIDINAGQHMDIKASGWIKNHAEAFFIGDTINGVPTDEYLEGSAHEVYINAFSDTIGSTTAPISIKSGGTPRVITTTLPDGSSATNNVSSYSSLSSITNVEIGKEFNIKNDIISNNFFPNPSEEYQNAATLSVGNKLKDGYEGTWANVSSHARSDAEGVISMRVNDVYEINDGADVHSTIELTPLDYKSLCKWVDSDGGDTYQSYMNMESYADTDNIVIGSKYMHGDDTYAQHDIKISNDNFTGIQLYGNYYDGESTASLDMNYSGINLSYDFPPDGMSAHVNMYCGALELFYDNLGYGVQETIELGTDGTRINASTLNASGRNSANIFADLNNYPNDNYFSSGINFLNIDTSTNTPFVRISALPSNYTSKAADGVSLYPCKSTTTYAILGSNYSTMHRWTGIYLINAPDYTSDERLKDFYEDIEVDLDALATLRKSYYSWKDDETKHRHIGVSAQEVQKLYPELVNEGGDGYLSLYGDKLAVVALAAIDKLHETNKELKAENDELRERLTRLENLVNEKLSAL